MFIDFQNQLLGKLAAINDAGLFNECDTIMSGRAVVDTDGGRYLNFRSPAPLQLNHCFEVASDTNNSISALERKVAQMLDAEDCIIYNSSIEANSAIANQLLDRPDALIYNSLGRFSLSGGPNFCRPTKYKYHGFDIDDIEKQLKLSQAQRFRAIMIDSVDMATGNVAPLNRIFALAEKYGAIVIIEQTLTAGIVGDGGRGICSFFQEQFDTIVHTGSLQYLGSNGGAYIAASREIVDFLRQHTSLAQFSSPMEKHNIAAAERIIGNIVPMNAERQYILQITNYFIKKLYCLGFEIPPTQTCRFAVMTGDAVRTEAIARTLEKKGVLVSALTPPYVGKDQCRLVMNLSVGHTKDDVETASSVFESIVSMFPKR